MEKQEIANSQPQPQQKPSTQQQVPVQQPKTEPQPQIQTVEKEPSSQPKPNQQIQSSIQQIDDEQQQENNGEEDNESNWTDATQSIAPDDEDDIWLVDDDIIDAMDIDSGQEDIEQESEEKPQGEEGSSENISTKKDKENQLDLAELEEQFVTGKESNEDWRLGKHDKFCTNVAVSQDGKSIYTGGGDDLMLCFREEGGQWKQFYRLKHTETVNKIQISHDGKYVVSLSENEAFCTEIANLDSQKFDIEEPSDIVCHKQGGVVAIAHDYTVSIYNLKGLSLFTSYSLDLSPTIISFCEKGKQIVAACDNKLRIITPKNGEIIKGSGDFHKEEISAIVTGNNTVYTGCIEGKVFASNITKGTVIGQLEPFKGTINFLTLSDNNQYLLVAPQGEGVHWVDCSKMKVLFQNPKDISVTDIIQVHSPTILAVSDLGGKIHIIDRRSPLEIIKTFDAGNSIHKLSSRGSQLYAACEDGFMRVFDVSK